MIECKVFVHPTSMAQTLRSNPSTCRQARFAAPEVSSKHHRRRSTSSSGTKDKPIHVSTDSCHAVVPVRYRFCVADRQGIFQSPLPWPLEQPPLSFNLMCLVRWCERLPNVVCAPSSAVPRLAVCQHGFQRGILFYQKLHVFKSSARNVCCSRSMAVGGVRPYLRSVSFCPSASERAAVCLVTRCSA